MSMPKRTIGLGRVLANVRLVQMDSKHSEREPPTPDLWQVTVEGYMVGLPLALEDAKKVRSWLDYGALRDITNLLREGVDR